MPSVSAVQSVARMLASLIGICLCAGARSQELRLGIIGADSTHAVQFTRILNGTAEKDHVAGARVTVAYAGGSALPISHDRIGNISQTLRSTWNIPFVPAIAQMCRDVDGILLLSVDPRLRMQELTEAATCGKPIFIDKPLAVSLEDAERIARFLDRKGIPWFSASSIRFGHGLPANLAGAETWGPVKYIEEFPLDLAYYGIHSIESLYSLMGPGVARVSRTRTDDADVLTAVWKDGRIGTVRLMHSDAGYGAVLYRAGAPVELLQTNVGYAPQVAAIVEFMRTRVSPVPEAETLEIFRFMQAAQESLRQNGAAVDVPAAR